MATKFKLECTGSNADSKIPKKVKDTITFETKSGCTRFTSFNFTTTPNPPAGFSQRDPATGGGTTISYEYDGSDIPADGYPFEYGTDSPALGNGSGTIKNT